MLTGYFEKSSPMDQRAMLASALRDVKPAQTGKKQSEEEVNQQMGAFLGGFLKGAGPLLHKLLQGLPMEGIPALATGLPFASRHEGCMHACGHDTHTAMLLGAGKVLLAHKDELAGTVRLMFQTAEEQSRGAEVMIENGGVEGADAVFGTHIGTILDKTIQSSMWMKMSSGKVPLYLLLLWRDFLHLRKLHHGKTKKNAWKQA